MTHVVVDFIHRQAAVRELNAPHPDVPNCPGIIDCEPSHSLAQLAKANKADMCSTCARIERAVRNAVTPVDRQAH